jgi:hypothetical protein
MAAPPKRPITAKRLQGFKYFRMLGPLLDRLRDAGTARDRAGNRKLHFDDYAASLLLYYFSPVLTSLRGLQQASTLQEVQARLGVPRTSTGALSEAATVFDAELLQGVIAELAGRAAPAAGPRERAALRDLVAVDGSLLPALPRMAWAAWQDDRHRAAKMHVAFEVLHRVPVGVTVTPGNASEREQLRRLWRPGRIHVLDRGYADYDLFREMGERGCHVVGRVQENAVFEVEHERPIPAAARAAGVVRDCTIRRLGTAKHNRLLERPSRVVVVATGDVRPDGSPVELVLVTDLLGWDAELIGLAYRYRWGVELFFRWLKCILGCRHLISEGRNGVTIQVYMAIIASLLIGLWLGRPASKRTYEMVCFYLSGWASEEELLAHIDKLDAQRAPPGNP